MYDLKTGHLTIIVLARNTLWNNFNEPNSPVFFSLENDIYFIEVC